MSGNSKRADTTPEIEALSLVVEPLMLNEGLDVASADDPDSMPLATDGLWMPWA